VGVCAGRPDVASCAGRVGRATEALPTDSPGSRAEAVIPFGGCAAFFALYTASEESRIKAERVRSGKRRGVQLGVHQGAWACYGYDQGEKRSSPFADRLVKFYAVVPEHAEVVREIFRRYVDGQTAEQIVLALDDRGVPPRRAGARSASTSGAAPTGGAPRRCVTCARTRCSADGSTTGDSGCPTARAGGCAASTFPASSTRRRGSAPRRSWLLADDLLPVVGATAAAEATAPRSPPGSCWRGWCGATSAENGSAFAARRTSTAVGVVERASATCRPYLAGSWTRRCASTSSPAWSTP